MSPSRSLTSVELLDALPDAIVATDGGGRIVLANRQAEAMFGYPPSALIGQPVEMLLPPSVRGDHVRHRQDYTAAPRLRPMGIGLDLRGRRRDGVEFPVEISLSPVETDQGRIVLAAVRDVTHQRAGEHHFRALLESAPDAMIITDQDGTITLVNSQAERLFGRDRSELIGASVDILVPERNRDRHGHHRDRYVRSPRARPMGAGLELTGLRADGTEIPVEISLSPLRTEHGTFTITAARDLTERRRADELGARAQRQAEVARLGVFALQGEGLDAVVDEAVRSVAATLGVEHAEVLELAPDEQGVHVRAGLGGDDWVPLAQSQAGWTLEHGVAVVEDLATDERFGSDRQLREHGVVSGITVAMRLDGRALGVLGAHSTTPRSFTESDVHFVQSVANVLAAAFARRRAEAALEQSTARLQAVLDHSPAAIYLKDLDGRYLFANAEFGRVVGVPVGQTLGRTDDELMPAEAAAPVRANDQLVLAARRPLRLAESVVVDGEERVYEVLRFPVLDEREELYGVGGVSVDVTDRVRGEAERAELAERLRRSERLESVGQLAGGMAHDFNNLLAVIANYAGFITEDVPEGSQLAQDVRQIVLATQQASELTRRLLQFSRRQPGHPEVLDVAQIVAELERLLGRTLGENVLLRTHCADDLMHVRADRGQLEQVLMNLALNARDAMPEGGELRIAAANAAFAPAPPADAAPGPYVRLSVTDTGVGMSPEVAARALEPFFTTKPSGSGTGLGLASVYGIVAQAGGWVDIDSELGRGTTVTAWLPATHERTHQQAVADAGPLGGGGQPVLVVEDQPDVREVTRRILSEAGYDVTAAESAEAALARLDEGLEPAILVTDVLMPGLTGPELADRIRERLPGLPVVFVSGFTQEVSTSGTAGGPPAVFVEKPFSAARLLQAVGDAIGSRV